MGAGINGSKLVSMFDVQRWFDTGDPRFEMVMNALTIKKRKLMKTKMNLDDALTVLAKGGKVKLPEWQGYWFIPEENLPAFAGETNDMTSLIKVMDRNGDVLDTPYMKDYRDRVDWYETDGFRDFGGALALLAAGKKVARRGWGGKGMFIFQQAGYPDGIGINKNTSEALGYPEGTPVGFRPYLMMGLPPGSTTQFGEGSNHLLNCVPWLPSQTDLLSRDWYMLYEHDNDKNAPTWPPLPSEVLYAFVAFLTVRDTEMTLGAKHTPGDLPQLIGEFCRINGLAGPRNGWEKIIEVMPDKFR